MKNHKSVLLGFSCLIFMIIAAASAIALPKIDEGRFVSDQCFLNGQIRLPVENVIDSPVDLDEIAITACVEDTDTCFDVTGFWIDKDYAETFIRASPEQEFFFFSDEGLFKEKGNYVVTMRNIPGADDEDYGIEYNVECYGYLYNCEGFDPKVYNCFVMDDQFYADFSLGGDPKIDPFKDIEYQLDWMLLQREEHFYDVPPGIEITDIGDGKYRLHFGMTEQLITNGVDSLRIREKNCNTKLFNVTSYKKCTPPPKVFCGNNKCDKGETCENCKADCCGTADGGSQTTTPESVTPTPTASPDDDVTTTAEPFDLGPYSSKLTFIIVCGAIVALIVIVMIVMFLKGSVKKD